MEKEPLTIKQIEACAANNYCPEGMTMAFVPIDKPDSSVDVPIKQNISTQPAATPIYVEKGVESWVLEKGGQALENAQNRERYNCGSELLPAVYFPTESESTLIDARDELVKRYQARHGADGPISLCPYPNIENIMPAMRQTVPSTELIPAEMKLPEIVEVVAEDKAPSVMELKDEYLKMRTMFRLGKVCYLYDGQIYQELSDNELESDINTALRHPAYKIDTPATIRAVAHAVRIEGSIAVKSIQEPTNRIPLLNGVLNTDNMKLEKYSPMMPFTWQMNTYWAEDNNACPMFDYFLNTAMECNQILVNRAWEIMGCCLFTRGQPAKKFFLFYGPSGNNGKSVLGDVLAAFYDPSMVTSLSMSQMGEKFTTASLAHSKINISMENSSDSLSPKAVGFLKACTGRDRVELSVKYKSDVITSISCPFIFGTNYRLKLQERDDAFADRVLVLPFQYSVAPENRDAGLTQKLIRELPGIFFKASHYFQALRSRGYRFSGDEIVEEILANEQRGEAFVSSCGPSLEESLEAFLNEHCQGKTGNFVPSKNILSSYLVYYNCDASSIDTKSFYTTLKKILKIRYEVVNKKKRVNGEPVSGYEGICLIEQ